MDQEEPSTSAFAKTLVAPRAPAGQGEEDGQASSDNGGVRSECADICGTASDSVTEMDTDDTETNAFAKALAPKRAPAGHSEDDGQTSSDNGDVRSERAAIYGTGSGSVVENISRGRSLRHPGRVRRGDICRGHSDGRGRSRGRGDGFRGRGRGDDASGTDFNRGRSESLRASYRGRGESSRGRGESPRGRGESPRGRGESSRGRGESSRGRFECSRGRGESFNVRNDFRDWGEFSGRSADAGGRGEACRSRGRSPRRRSFTRSRGDRREGRDLGPSPDMERRINAIMSEYSLLYIATPVPRMDGEAQVLPRVISYMGPNGDPAHASYLGQISPDSPDFPYGNLGRGRFENHEY